MNGWASTSHRTTSFAPPNSQGGTAGNRVSPLAFKWLATDATGCERAIFGNPRWTDAHRRTHRTTTSRRDQATRNGTSAARRAPDSESAPWFSKLTANVEEVVTHLVHGVHGHPAKRSLAPRWIVVHG